MGTLLMYLSIITDCRADSRTAQPVSLAGQKKKEALIFLESEFFRVIIVWNHIDHHSCV